ncbi:MAG: Rieske (2Fe-2S) protein [Sphingobacteriaceae bacterium]
MKKGGLFTGMVVLLMACGKDNGSYIPDVYVNYSIPINDPSISALNSPGGAVVINGQGVAGIIIYHRSDNVYVAYDRCSSVNPQNKCAVTLDNPNLTVTDPCSGAKFSLFDGTPVKAPATKSLKSYQVTANSLYLMVMN